MDSLSTWCRAGRRSESGVSVGRQARPTSPSRSGRGGDPGLHKLRGEPVRGGGGRWHLVLPHQAYLVLRNVLLREIITFTRARQQTTPPSASRYTGTWSESSHTQTSSLRTSSLAVGAEMTMRRASSLMNPSLTAMSMKDSSGS